MTSIDVWDRLLPVVTLVAGAALSRLGQRPVRRRDAAHLLASMKRHVWNRRRPDGWLELQEYLGRLWVELRMAGVPRRLVRRLELAAEAYWAAVEDSGDPEVGHVLIDRRIAEDLDQIRGDVYDWLDSPWHLVRRYRIWRKA